MVGNYILNLNSREMSFEDKKLKLTEKEIDTIVYFLKLQVQLRYKNYN